MKLIYIIICISIIAFESGCKKHNPTIRNTAPSNNVCKNLEIYCTNDTCGHFSAPFSLISDTIIGDYLKLTISYGGGCQNHDFKLVWEQIVTPPFDYVRLEHNANGDICKSLITQELCFNLNILKQGQAHGENDFPFSDSNGKTITVKYKY